MRNLLPPLLRPRSLPPLLQLLQRRCSLTLQLSQGSGEGRQVRQPVQLAASSREVLRALRQLGLHR